MTTGAVVARVDALGSRILIAPMANLCGVLARWQQVKRQVRGSTTLCGCPPRHSMTTA
ncbi:hypothetical protein KCP70_04720 [Salmonella enterica subsp. enterica]|nr:hypothetical protein KCP70_04720 [Salmonella enterica subsp. enterica]